MSYGVRSVHLWGKVWSPDWGKGQLLHFKRTRTPEGRRRHQNNVSAHHCSFLISCCSQGKGSSRSQAKKKERKRIRFKYMKMYVFWWFIGLKKKGFSFSEKLRKGPLKICRVKTDFLLPVQNEKNKQKQPWSNTFEFQITKCHFLLL